MTIQRWTGCVILAFAGIALWWLSGDLAQRVAAEPAPPPEAGESPTSSGTQDPDVTDSSVAAAELRSLIRRALEKVPAYYTESGTGVIRGRVVDAESGQPLAGLLLAAQVDREIAPMRFRDMVLDAQAPNDRPSLIEHYVELAADAIEESRARPSTDKTTTTGLDGTFEFTGLENVGHTIDCLMHGIELMNSSGAKLYTRPNRDGFRRFHMLGRFPLLPGSDTTLSATLKQGLRICVQFADGAPVTSAKVEYAAVSGKAGDELAFVEADWSGQWDSIELPVGKYRIRATSRDSSQISSEGEVTVDHTGSATNAVIKLPSSPGIVVTLDDRNSDWDFSGLELQCFVVPADFKESAAAVKQVTDTERPIGPRDSNRTFRSLWGAKLNGPRIESFAADQAGRYLVVAVRLGEPYAHTLVTLAKGETQRVTLNLPEPSRPDYAVVLVKDPRGAVLDKNLEVSVSASSRRGFMGESWLTCQGPDGSLLVAFPAPEDARPTVVASEYVVQVTHPKFGTLTKTFKRTSTTEVEAQFATPATVDVVIADLANHPAKVHLTAQIEIRRGSMTTWSESGVSRPQGIDGVFRFGPFQPGTFLADFQLSGILEEDYVIAEVEATIKSGANQVPLTLPPLHVLKVMKQGMTKDSRLTIAVKRDVKRRHQWAREMDVYILDSEIKDGCITLPFLPTSTVTITYAATEGAEGDTRKVDLKESTTIDLDAK